MRMIKFLSIWLIVISIKILPQNIDAQLGSAGIFKIKSNNNTTILSITNDEASMNFIGSLILPNSSNYATGVIYKDAYRFLHDKGTNNVFLGKNAGNFFIETTAEENSGIGSGSLTSLTTGSFNSGFGANSLFNNTEGLSNSAFGTYSLEFNTIGTGNSALGVGSLRSNTTGSFNTATGLGALLSNTSGDKNTAIGFQSLSANADGFHNTAVGYQSLLISSGNYNTAIGFNAGSSVTTGANLTLIGIDANPSSPTTLDEITLGNQFVQTLRCNATTITSLSDARDKKNITDLTLGLNFLMKIQPRQFNWDRREWYSDGKSDGSKMQELPTAGFIAQELDQVQSESDAEWLKLVLKENPDRFEASSGNLFPVVVKAIQDLKNEKDNEIALLKSENQKLKIEIDLLKELQTRLARLEQVINSSDMKFSSNITE